MLLQDGHKGGYKWGNMLKQILSLKFPNGQNPWCESLYNNGPVTVIALTPKKNWVQILAPPFLSWIRYSQSSKSDRHGI